MTTKRNIEDRVNDLKDDADTDADSVTDEEMGVTTDFVIYEANEDAPKYQVVGEEDT